MPRPGQEALKADSEALTLRGNREVSLSRVILQGHVGLVLGPVQPRWETPRETRRAHPRPREARPRAVQEGPGDAARDEEVALDHRPELELLKPPPRRSGAGGESGSWGAGASAGAGVLRGAGALAG